ncbi:MAG: C25 family cysteine peptidase [Chloroflexota bacterium]
MNRTSITNFYRKKSLSTAVALLLVCSLLLSVSPAQAQGDAKVGAAITAQTSVDNIQASMTAPLQINSTATSTSIQWGGATGRVSAASIMNNLPTLRYGGYNLPMQLTTLEISDGIHIENIHRDVAQISDFHVEEWLGQVDVAEELVPLTDDSWNKYPELRSDRVLKLPSAPVFVLREGRQRDQHIAIVAFSPIYMQDGIVKVTTQGHVEIQGAIQQGFGLTSDVMAASRNSVSSITPVQPTNPLASKNAAKIIVSSAGIQEVTGEKIRDAGFSIPDLSRLQLFYNGSQVALHIIDQNEDNILDDDDIIRFYADANGDYWNSQQIYWLGLNSTPAPGLRMDVLTLTETGAIPRQDGIEKGVWEDNQHYTSLIAGADGDYWSAVSMQTEPSQVGIPEKFPTADVAFNARLPLANSGNATFRITLSAFTAAEYTLELEVDGETLPEFIWDSRDGKDPGEKFKQEWELEATTTLNGTTGQVRLIPDDFSAGMVLDKIYWEQPVRLDFGSRGATFSGVDGFWSYRLSSLPSEHAIYDVTNANDPDIVPTDGGASVTFEAGPNAADYIVAGEGTLFEPEVLRHEGTTFASNDGVDALYIAPSAFIEALQPLVNLRESQGYQVKVINVQDIYDTWSYGHIAPSAIRDFLRFAVGSWNPAPISVVLVGDGTEDPKNYLGKNNINHIPPYMAEIDPWIKRTSCERCYAQLHGDDPLVTSLDPDFLTDIQLGRLPAKAADDVSIIVSKIVAYETSTDLNTAWRGTSVFLADNYIERVNSSGSTTVDKAGDFARYSDVIIDIHPTEMNIERIYYDPYPEIGDPNGLEPWRQPDSIKAREDSVALLSAGAGLVSYNGHSNHWQWATTDINQPNPRLMGLNEVQQLSNVDKYFVALSMTCYTSQFQKPATVGTLDESMMLHRNGGAVATWGSSGLSVAHGHDALQKGFHTALWQAEPLTAKMGDLVDAGYKELMDHGGSCCQDARQTFLLMGDPLMRVLVTPFDESQVPEPLSIFLPIIQNER